MPSVAVRYAGWLRRLGAQAGPLGAAPGAVGEAPNGLMVELLVDGSWVNITSRVMVRDNSGQISITRGQSSEGRTPDPGTCSFLLNNRDGLFSPSNPVSPYYGKIGRNTQLRVSVPNGENKNYRFWGEVSAWPEDWDTTDTDVWVDVEAAGILRRLNQGSTPLRSTMYRGLTSSATTTPVAYWPCEDMSQATSVASALGGSPMKLIGSPNLAADTGFACSAPLPTMNSGSLVGTIPTYAVTGQSQVRFLLFLPTAPPDGTQLVKVRATGSVPYWVVAYGTGGGLAIKGIDTDGLTVLCNSGAVGFNVDGERVRVSMELTQNGSNVNYTINTTSVTTGSVLTAGGTFSSQTVGQFTAVTVCPGQTITDGVFGHISVQSDVTSAFDLAGQVTAFVGETVNSRISRLCSEQGVNYTSVGTQSSDTMGPQLPAKFLDLIQECVDVDQGILFERETSFGLAYKARASLLNQSARLTLSYPGHQLAAIPRPVPDDQNVRNDVTVSRPSGSSATSTLETGALSILPPPNGVGVYSDAPTINVEEDNDLQQHAAWRVHLGTVDEPRYPAISINLAHPAMAALRDDALRMLFGARVVVTSPPSRLGGDISQLCIGISETLTHFEHRLTFVGQPESPYRVATLDDTVYGRLDTSGSNLAGDMTPTSTTVQVTTTGQQWVTTAVNPAEFPFDVTVDGEQMTVTGITSTSSPQTFTVTRSVNGVIRTHQVGADLRLTHPMILAL